MKDRIYFRLLGTVLFLLILSSCNNGEEKNTVSKYYPTKILSPDSRTVQVQYPAVLKGRQSDCDAARESFTELTAIEPGYFSAKVGSTVV